MRKSLPRSRARRTSTRPASRTSSSARPAAQVARPSTIQISTPAGALPRVVQGLNLSKLVRRSGLRSRSVPPRGASRVDIVEVREVGAVLGRAVGGEGVHPAAGEVAARRGRRPARPAAAAVRVRRRVQRAGQRRAQQQGRQAAPRRVDRLRSALTRPSPPSSAPA